MDDQNKNLILAVVLSGIVMLVWSMWFQPPPPPVDLTLPPSTQTGDGVATPPAVADTQTPAVPDTEIGTQTAALDSAPRVKIDTAELGGSITLYGGRLDDLKLKSYRETLDEDSDLVTLLSPIGQDHPYYAL